MIDTVNLGINFRAHTPPTRAKLLECCVYWRRALRQDELFIQPSSIRGMHRRNLWHCQRMLRDMRNQRR